MLSSKEQTMMMTEIGLAQSSYNNTQLDPELKNELMKELSPQDLRKIKKGFDLFKGVHLHHGRRVVRQETRDESLLQRDTDLHRNLPSHRSEKDFTNYLIDRQGLNGQEQQRNFQAKEELNRLQINAEKVFILKSSPMIGVLQANKKSMSLLQKDTYKPVQSISFGGTIINFAIYLSEFEVYCISTNDKFINFYDSSENELIRRLALPDPVFYMVAHGQGNASPKLVVGSTNGHLYEFNLRKTLAIINKKDKDVLREEELRKQQLPATELYRVFMSGKMLAVQPDLTCIDRMAALELLVTGSNDSRIRLYEMREHGPQLVKELDGHFKGIKGVAVSEMHKVVVSCSFDFDLLVWNAYLEHPVARLEGHEAPLVNVCCPVSHDIFISLDTRSIVKIWNAENYQQIQTLLLYENLPVNTSLGFLYKDETDVAVVFTKKLRFYQFKVSYNPRLSDDYEGAVIRYSPKNLQVYIGSRKSIKVWSVERGVQIRVYSEAIGADISVMEIDGRERRLFVGSIEGEVSAIDVFSGLLIAKYSKHVQEISLLMYSEDTQLLVSGGWERKLKIHNDTKHLQRIENRDNVMRTISNVSEKDLAGGCFSEAEMLIATHAKANHCRLWDFEKGFLEAQITVSNEIVLTAFLSPLPLLTLADSKGSIYLFSTKHYLSRPFSLLTQWKNMYSIQKSSQITFIKYQCREGKHVLGLESKSETKKTTSNSSNKQLQSHPQHLLILGDEYGYVRIVDISAFIQENNIRPVTSDMLGNKNPYRIEDYNYLGASNELSVNMHDFTEHQSKVIMPPDSIKQLLQIKAHKERVNYISLIHEAEQALILSAGSDRLVKIWNYQGQQRGVLKQGFKQNPNWHYKLDGAWQNKQNIKYYAIKDQLDDVYEHYLMKKRLSVIPFTEQEQFDEVDNNQIYKDLKEVDGYLSKANDFQDSNKKKSRLF